MELVSELSQMLSYTEQDTLKLILNAPYKYRVYTIPKRAHGRRTIAQPTKEVKKLQKFFIKNHPFPSHSSSMAYRKNFSIKNNAEAHKDNAYLLKMDLANFFNSIVPEILWSAWVKFWPLPETIEMRLIENIIFWNNNNQFTLSVGAPSSPDVSNFCLFQLDESIYKYCSNNNISYTRYADDLTFSTNEKNNLIQVPSLVADFLKNIFGTKISINHQKTVFSSKAHNRHITGITITNDGTISVGRERKRYIKHLIHQFSLGKLSSEDIKHLRGLISFAQHIEPNIISSLCNKYSLDLINMIIKEVK
jgi:retron-type reverse transcriptase